MHTLRAQQWPILFNYCNYNFITVGDIIIVFVTSLDWLTNAAATVTVVLLIKSAFVECETNSVTELDRRAFKRGMSIFT